MDVFEIVKAKLPADKLPEDILLGLIVAEVGQTILTYLNRTDMPKELAFTYANMVVDMITGENRKNDPGSQSSVSAIKEGDVQVTFVSSKVESREIATEGLLFDYSQQLNKFRKLRW
ncbi:hypothetical protein FQ087_18300 [Sporosarcina sp. ANT_H38]|uniref:hypothetical protein n=1 Tax=Sporosarcina sp. ANT_H38 TaxID=2597358 RepID=UPI0011F34256|nr:hypothetical protein [Sporosarcina sp. ANT_H38]KAA0944078.1 hypothetical protein FQ087_18300 [Sporosarcina sp. ANT_H38]